MGKNLANCKPSEFLKQTYKIKRSVAEWMDAVDVLAILKQKPQLIATAALPEEERKKAEEANAKIARDQVKKNLSDLLDKALEENAEKTLEVMALCCFIEPEDADNHPMSEYLESLGELISDAGVMSFFTSLVQLGQTDIVTAVKL